MKNVAACSVTILPTATHKRGFMLDNRFCFTVKDTDFWPCHQDQAKSRMHRREPGTASLGQNYRRMKQITRWSNVDVKNALVGHRFSFINLWKKEIFRNKHHRARSNSSRPDSSAMSQHSTWPWKWFSRNSLKNHHSRRRSHAKAITTFRPGGVWQLLFTFYAEFIRRPTWLRNDEDAWNKARQIRDPDNVTAEAQMWDKDYLNNLYNPHYHTACPTARSWHNSDLWTLLRMIPMIPGTPGTEATNLL
jgi:hypothetical protein